MHFAVLLPLSLLCSPRKSQQCNLQGSLFPMCGMNLAFNRELIGPAMYFGLMGEGYPIGRYDDMWAGWCVKVGSISLLSSLLPLMIQHWLRIQRARLFPDTCICIVMCLMIFQLCSADKHVACCALVYNVLSKWSSSCMQLCGDSAA